MSRRLAVVVLMLSLAGAGRAEAPAAGPPRGTSDPRVTSARAVLAAVVKAAAQNHRLPRLDDVGANGPYRRVGDNLTVYYVRAGAAAARQLPAEQSAPAFLLALGIALDDSPLLRQSLVTGALWRKVETDGERLRRLRVLGEPTLYGRHDLAQHFAVSAALTATSGAAAAETAGILKEMLDARAGGSGFSFADLAADFSGIAFARRLLAQPSVLASIEQSFTPTDYALSPTGLAEGLSAAGFARQYGSIQDARFRRMLAYIRRRIHALPGYRTLDTKKNAVHEAIVPGQARSASDGPKKPVAGAPGLSAEVRAAGDEVSGSEEVGTCVTNGVSLEQSRDGHAEARQVRLAG